MRGARRVSRRKREEASRRLSLSLSAEGESADISRGSPPGGRKRKRKGENVNPPGLPVLVATYPVGEFLSRMRSKCTASRRVTRSTLPPSLPSFLPLAVPQPSEISESVLESELVQRLFKSERARIRISRGPCARSRSRETLE